MIETIIIAMIAAKIKGYRLKPVFKAWEMYPVFFFMILYFLLNAGVFIGSYGLVKYAGIIEKAYFCALIVPIFKHRLYVGAIAGSICVIIGTLLNRLVISANNGKMPVFPSLSYITGYVKAGSFAKVDELHILGSSSVKLKFLSDYIDLGYSILSVGDIFIRVFTFIVIFNTIKCINITRKRAQTC